MFIILLKPIKSPSKINPKIIKQSQNTFMSSKIISYKKFRLVIRNPSLSIDS